MTDWDRVTQMTELPRHELSRSSYDAAVESPPKKELPSLDALRERLSGSRWGDDED